MSSESELSQSTEQVDISSHDLDSLAVDSDRNDGSGDCAGEVHVADEPSGGGTVWATAQQPPATQRRGRYVAESAHHPAKMLPAIAAQTIATFTRPGELVLDPMCGIGTTLVEAVRLGRRAV